MNPLKSKKIGSIRKYSSIDRKGMQTQPYEKKSTEMDHIYQSVLIKNNASSFPVASERWGGGVRRGGGRRGEEG